MDDKAIATRLCQPRDNSKRDTSWHARIRVYVV